MEIGASGNYNVHCPRQMILVKPPPSNPITPTLTSNQPSPQLGIFLDAKQMSLARFDFGETSGRPHHPFLALFVGYQFDV